MRARLLPLLLVATLGSSAWAAQGPTLSTRATRGSIWHSHPERRVHLGFELLTDFPVRVGGQLWVELPGRVRLSTSVGYMPDAYLGVTLRALVAVGAFDASTSRLIRTTLQRAVTWRVHLGWRPWRRHGGYAELGYSLLAVEGSLGMARAASEYSGIDVPDTPPYQGALYSHTLVHFADVEAGWMWSPWRGLTLRLSLGVAVSFLSRTRVDGAQIDAQFQSLMPAAAQMIDDAAARYLILPCVGFAAGWRVL